MQIKKTGIYTYQIELNEEELIKIKMYALSHMVHVIGQPDGFLHPSYRQAFELTEDITKAVDR